MYLRPFARHRARRQYEMRDRRAEWLVHHEVDLAVDVVGEAVEEPAHHCRVEGFGEPHEVAWRWC